MWIELIRSFSKECEFVKPTNIQVIEEVEKEFELLFHNDLKSILLESNGITGEYGLGLLWTIERIKTDNISFRANEDFMDLYMPFDNLLFFADAGNGDQFAYSIQNGQINRNDIFVWNHEDDSRIWVAPDLKKYFEWWMSGKLKI